MTQFISLLRGINVGGNRKIKMADLKAVYEFLGFTNVISYIQSGNVIFNAPTDNKNELKTIIEQAIEQKFGFEVAVDIKTLDELKQLFQALPFENINIVEDGSKILISFLSTQPQKENITDLLTYVKAPEQIIVSKDCAYINYPNGCGRSKLTNVLIEKKLAVTATARNLKTVAKLIALAEGEEGE